MAVATQNVGKLRDLQAWLATPDLVLQQAPKDFDVAETGQTFHDNAALKACALQQHLGIPTLADDSGLCVDALQGEPGLFSARYSDELDPQRRDDANRRKLLHNMQAVPAAHRTAHFTCVLAWCRAPNDVLFFEGMLRGHIAEQARGSGGFGYDAIFIPWGFTHTLAELPAHVRQAVSHRAMAVTALRHALHV